MNRFTLHFIKLLAGDCYPLPTDNFVNAIYLLFILFLCLFIISYKQKLKFNFRPILFSIPAFSFLISYIGIAYGGVWVLDAIANIPEAQRFQAIATGIATSVNSMFMPGILIFAELLLCVIKITIDSNRKNRSNK